MGSLPPVNGWPTGAAGGFGFGVGDADGEGDSDGDSLSDSVGVGEAVSGAAAVEDATTEGVDAAACFFLWLQAGRKVTSRAAARATARRRRSSKIKSPEG
jgi:hypothetical protein